MESDKQFISLEFSQTSLKERDRRLAILLEMSNHLSSSMQLRDLLTGALAKVREHFEMDAGRIYLLDAESHDLHLAAYDGLDPADLEEVSIEGSFSGKAFRTKSLIAQYVSELEDKERAALLLSKGYEIVICVPLIIRDRVEGVMNLTAGNAIELDQAKIDLLTTIGNQIAVATNNVRLYEELNRKLDDLQEKKDVIKFFAYSISHDLKSPATALYAMAKRLREKSGESLDEKGKECCDQIMKTAEQMAAMVDKVNAYIAAKEAPFDFQVVRFKEITGTVRNEFSSILEERKIKWSEPEDLPEIRGDKLALIRVFRNLVDNALKYGGKEMAEIKIGRREKKGALILTFSDNGVGISGADKDKIFEVFQRNYTSRGTPGCGLGLAIVKEVMERHGGRVWLGSDKDRGSTFYLSFPKNSKL